MEESDELVCVICKQNLGDTFVVVNSEKGLSTLIAKSNEKKDNLASIFGNVSCVKLHSACRRDYTYRSNDNTSVLKENTNICNVVKLRSSTSEFNFSKHCLYCGNEASKEKEIKKPRERRNTICDVKSTDLKSITDIINKNTIENDSNILLRISGIIDLKTVGAKYHKKCNSNFLLLHGVENHKRSRSKSVGRPADSAKIDGFQKLCEFISNNENQSFSIQELTSKMKEFSSEIYHIRYLQDKLVEHFGDDIIISCSSGKQTIVSLRSKTIETVRESHMREKKSDTQDENIKLIEKAANLIKQDIKCKNFENENYEAFDINSLNKLIPDSLKTFLDILMSQNKSDIKVAAVAHSIISAVSPRSFLSPLQVAVSVWLHKKFGSRYLIDMISALGVSSSYSEVIRFEQSATVAASPDVTADGFMQFIFDNADMNQATLTGKGTFHCMGGVKTVTPVRAVQRALKLARLNMTSSVPLNGEQIPILVYSKPTSLGLRQIKLQNIDVFADSIKIQSYLNLNVLIVSARSLSTSVYLPWSGFMQIAVETKPCNHEQSAIIYLPFINLSPSNPSAVFSALKFALSETRKHKQTTCFTTFDQPLAEKATDIVAASQPELQGIIVRLGGFHLMFSFVAAISYFMDGSGLTELWSTVYAENSVPHMLSGKAISRALRAHFLTYDSLTRLALKKSNENLEIEIKEAESVMKNLCEQTINYEAAASNSSIIKLNNVINTVINESVSTSRTAALWAQYRKQVALLRLYITSERVGDWSLHLHCVREMIPLFHAAGHLNYAKSAHMYLQSMINLNSNVPENELNLFINAGYFTIRRNSKFWSGCWTDLIIEQCLMRSIKSSGGLSRGRGTSESTLIKWTASMPACTEFSNMLENVTGLKSKSSEQHVDLTPSRQRYEKCHATQFDAWFEDHSPFEHNTSNLVSLSSGIIGDESINCDKAEEIGNKLLQQALNKNTTFGDLHLKRKERVLPLAAVNNSVKINDNVIVVHHDQIFNRVSCLNLDQTDRIATFGHELAPNPTSLFDKQHNMREGTKSSLQDIIHSKCEKNTHCSSNIDSNGIYVIDGGFLLHKVVWPRPAKFGVIINSYVNYVTKHYGKSATIIVVFDGYDKTVTTTKSHAHQHRYKSLARRKIIFNLNTEYSGSQSDFLSCAENKERLIELLDQKLNEKSVRVVRAKADADTTIATTAIQEASNSSPVYVIATDTDILTILLQRSSADLNITMISPAGGRSKKDDKIFHMPTLQNTLGVTSKCILFLHAMTGCDTTSAPYRRGKAAAFKLLQSDVKLQNIALSFNQRFISKQEIISGGETFLLALYKSTADNLDLARFITYNQITRESDVKRTFELASLPPTSDAGAQHTLRAYLQVQEWLGTSLEPTEWGWKKRDENILVPITMTQEPAPAFVLHMMSCNCKTDCSSKRCSCRSNGIPCTAMCGRCCGYACSNHEEMHEEAEDIDEEPLDDATPPATTTGRRKSETLDNSPRKRRTSTRSETLEIPPLRL